MAKIPSLASVDIRPEGFSALKHEPRKDLPLHPLGCMCPECGRQDRPLHSATLIDVQMLINAEDIIKRLRAALKTCGFTTEEIDSIAFDTHDGVRVVMEGHIIP